ncbi:P4HA [Mytilus edulis]|uniref:P4HA n=1 Tax=Mytilus edulis TaxID=6550 RepID=A0A8S3R5E6_MYTED|nr:P4HA [Mytilus edulis]
MTTSPRLMQNLANARMANNTSITAAAEVTRLVRQHFDPPPASPYRYRKVCQKTSQTLLHERPESTWQENYERRDHHMKCGYYSLPNEPYRNVGGQFDLDPYDLVLKTISKNLDVKRAKSPTKSECQLLEDKQSDGGISTIKDQIYDLQTAKKYVLAGQSFETSLNNYRERKERMKRIHIEYLEATPLSFDHLKQLRKDTVFTLQTHGDGNMLSRQSRPYKNASVVSTVASENKVGGFAGLFAKKKPSNMFVQVAMLPAKLAPNKFSQMFKPKQKEPELKLESWEDFLAVDPHTPMPEKKKKKMFATGVMALVKAVQWQKIGKHILYLFSDLNATYQIVTRNIAHWPDEYDVQASAQALLRLRTFYYFNIDEAINEHSEVLNANEQNDINEEEEADISFVREEYDDNYKQLCRENRKTPKESSKLYCYLSDTVIPYYKGKVEIANLQPKIFLFHDVISDREALYLRNEGSKEEKPLWGPISEDEPDDLRGTGDRIATWLFYLNDVKVGGATVFPNINTRIPVIQGGAAFWFNLLPSSGVTDNRTMHAGCPVVIGSKWVGNKWIREAGQMFRRPCDLQP